jgi:hypothetical protein
MIKNPKTLLVIASIKGEPQFFHRECLAKGISSGKLKDVKLLESFENPNRYGNRICYWCGKRFSDIPDPDLKHEPFMSRFEMTSFIPQEIRDAKFYKQEFSHALKRKNPFGDSFGKALENMGKTIRAPRKKKSKSKSKRKNPCAPCMLMANPRKKKSSKKKKSR